MSSQLVVSHHEKPLIVRRDRKRAPDQRSRADSVRDREQDAGRFRRKGRTRMDPHDIHLPVGDVEQLAPVVRPERSTATAARDLPLAAVHIRKRADEHLVRALLVRHVREPTGIRRQRRARLVGSRRHDPARQAVHSRMRRENVPLCRSPCRPGCAEHDPPAVRTPERVGRTILSPEEPGFAGAVSGLLPDVERGSPSESYRSRWAGPRET